MDTSNLTKINPSLDVAAKAGDALVAICHGDAVRAGWWTDLETGECIVPTRPVVSEKLLLIHSEVSEATEGLRKGLPDDKLPHRRMLDVELADAAIRIFDLAGAMAVPLGTIIAEKLAYNRQRDDHKIENRKADGGKSF